MEVLICAATSIEERGCRVGLKRVGLKAPFKILGTGIGLEQAEKSLTQYLHERHHPDLIVSSGFAGAVTDDLPLHSWIVAEKIFSESGEVTGLAVSKNIPGTIRSSIVSLPYLYSPDKVDQIPCSLFSQSLAVDMETASLVKIAACYRIPFMALRLITDTPTEPLPRLIYQIEDHSQRNKEKLRFTGQLVLDILGNIPEVRGALHRMVICSKLLSDGWEKYAPVILAQF